MLKATLTEALADLAVADAMVTVYAAGLRTGTVEENCAKLQEVLGKVRMKLSTAAAHLSGIAGTARRLGAEVGVMLDGLRPGETPAAGCGGPEKAPAPRNTVAEELARLVDGTAAVT